MGEGCWWRASSSLGPCPGRKVALLWHATEWMFAARGRPEGGVRETALE